MTTAFSQTALKAPGYLSASPIVRDIIDLYLVHFAARQSP